MKKTTLFLFAISLSIQTFAQITLEKLYIGMAGKATLRVVKFTDLGEKYVSYNVPNSSNNYTASVQVYNLDHSLYKLFQYSMAPCSNWIGNIDFGVGYISDKLFDADNKIEVAFHLSCDSKSTTVIINEDGVVLKQFNTIGFSIYNTSSGAKLIARNSISDSIEVYSLPGTLVSRKTELKSDYETGLSAPYPNPTDNYTKIDYQLPQGINKGEIIFYDIQGRTVKKFTVDRAFDNLIISTDNLPSGTYYYNIQTTLGISQSKKMVMIK